jgi:sensor domain CHASE-containing protein
MRTLLRTIGVLAVLACVTGLLALAAQTSPFAQDDRQIADAG